MEFKTAETFYYPFPGVPPAGRAYVIAAQAQMQAGGPPRELPPDEAKRSDVVALAYVNGGRWVADCPTPGCSGAQVVSREDPRYLCPYCDNGDSREWIGVKWPRNAGAIEAALRERPERIRNWRPQGVWDQEHETVGFLEAENEELRELAALGVDPDAEADRRRWSGG